MSLAHTSHFNDAITSYKL